MEFPSIIYPFNKYLLNFYFMPGTVLIGFNSAQGIALLPKVLPALGGGGRVGIRRVGDRAHRLCQNNIVSTALRESGSAEVHVGWVQNPGLRIHEDFLDNLLMQEG